MGIVNSLFGVALLALGVVLDNGVWHNVVVLTCRAPYTLPCTIASCMSFRTVLLPSCYFTCFPFLIKLHLHVSLPTLYIK